MWVSTALLSPRLCFCNMWVTYWLWREWDGPRRSCRGTVKNSGDAGMLYLQRRHNSAPRKLYTWGLTSKKERDLCPCQRRYFGYINTNDKETNKRAPGNGRVSQTLDSGIWWNRQTSVWGGKGWRVSPHEPSRKIKLCYWHQHPHWPCLMLSSLSTYL